MPVQAQNFPDRPVRMVVAFVPGGATDTLARQISQDLKEALGRGEDRDSEWPREHRAMAAHALLDLPAGAGLPVLHAALETPGDMRWGVELAKKAAGGR